MCKNPQYKLKEALARTERFEKRRNKLQ